MGKLKTKLMEFNKETGTSIFVYAYKDQVFEGISQCHADDMDMCSELVGLKYAETRAYLEYLKFRKKEIKLRVETLEGILRHMSTSKDFDITSGYGKKIQNAICESRCELQEIREAVENIPPYLKDDISAREDLYSKLRKRRKDLEKDAE